MSTRQLHVIGQGHEARFSEDFAHVLADAVNSTADPASATTELDDVALLTVLANFAGVGPTAPGAHRTGFVEATSDATTATRRRARGSSGHQQGRPARSPVDRV